MRGALPYKTIEELVAADQPFHVWVISYALQVGRIMWLSVHDGGVFPACWLQATWCRSWRGALEGGPYRLCLESTLIPSAPDEPVPGVRFFDRAGGFELICGTLRVGDRRETGISF